MPVRTNTPSRGEVMMCLALAGLHRGQAAELVGISDGKFRRLMQHYRIKAPKANAKLTPVSAQEIRELLEKHSQKEVAALKGVHW